MAGDPQPPGDKPLTDSEKSVKDKAAQEALAEYRRLRDAKTRAEDAQLTPEEQAAVLSQRERDRLSVRVARSAAAGVEPVVRQAIQEHESHVLDRVETRIQEQAPGMAAQIGQAVSAMVNPLGWPSIAKAAGQIGIGAILAFFLYMLLNDMLNRQHEDSMRKWQAIENNSGQIAKIQASVDQSSAAVARMALAVEGMTMEIKREWERQQRERAKPPPRDDPDGCPVEPLSVMPRELPDHTAGGNP